MQLLHVYKILILKISTIMQKHKLKERNKVEKNEHCSERAFKG
jgi:hypothetical protein